MAAPEPLAEWTAPGGPTAAERAAHFRTHTETTTPHLCPSGQRATLFLCTRHRTTRAWECLWACAACQHDECVLLRAISTRGADATKPALDPATKARLHGLGLKKRRAGGGGADNDA